MGDTDKDLERDLGIVARLEAVPSLLQLACDATGMGFAAVARVAGSGWTVCALIDHLGLGLHPGDPLTITTTLGRELQAARRPVAIDATSADPAWRGHAHGTLAIESWVSVPILLGDTSCFGHLCAFDTQPARVSDAHTLGLLTGFAQLLARLIDAARRGEPLPGHFDERAAAELREQFIAVLGHDLRNPLNVVATGAQVLKLTAGDAEVREVVQRIERAVHRMSGLIDAVLDFARGRLGGGFDVHFEQVHDVGQLLREVVDEARSTHPGRAIEVSIDAPQAVRCDRTRVQQLASNLMSNALKHGAEHAPVQFSATVSEGSVVITVANQGEPIPAENLSKVFQPFWREAGSRREGLGLGLFICAEIVRAHGGRIEVMSSRDHGTTFAVHLPVGGAPVASA